MLSMMFACAALSADESVVIDTSEAELSRGGNDFRTAQVRKYFERQGRDFGGIGGIDRFCFGHQWT